MPTRPVPLWSSAELDPSLSWGDVFGVSLLAGVGFAVSLLLGGLAFGVASGRDDRVKLALLTGSLLAATLAAIVLRRRNRHYRALADAAATDTENDTENDTEDDKDDAMGPPTSR